MLISFKSFKTHVLVYTKSLNEYKISLIYILHDWHFNIIYTSHSKKIKIQLYPKINVFTVYTKIV